jgi:hypothetical protein
MTRRRILVTLAALAALAVLAALTGCGGGPASSTAPPTPPPPAAADTGAVLLGDLSDVALFPAGDPWNLDVSAAPVDPRSQAFIDFISGRTPADPAAVRRAHPDFGPPPYGIPYAVVRGTQPRVPVTFVLYGGESDAGAPGQEPGYPIPSRARTEPDWIEGGEAGGGAGGDRHLLLVDRDRRLLFETWATRWDAGQARWEAASGAVFDLATGARRPEGWTSADAAGLAILPGLVRWDEATGTTPVAHAFRVTVRATNGHVWPASHTAGSTAGALPMGARLRLKASKDLSTLAAPVRRIFEAMKTHGLIVADNGSDLYVSGTMDARWDNDVLNPAFHALTADDFEVVRLGWGAPAAPR